MALIKCPECEREISDKAPSCVHCGCPIECAPQSPEIDVRAILQRNNLSKFATVLEIRKMTGMKREEAKQLVEDAVSGETYSFADKLKAQVRNINEENAAKRKQEKERIAQIDREGTAYCPKCKSASLSAHKKGFGIGKAVVGAMTSYHLLGLVAGNLGARKVRVTCLKCGYQFWAGQK